MQEKVSLFWYPKVLVQCELNSPRPDLQFYLGWSKHLLTDKASLAAAVLTMQDCCYDRSLFVLVTFCHEMIMEASTNKHTVTHAAPDRQRHLKQMRQTSALLTQEHTLIKQTNKKPENLLQILKDNIVERWKPWKFTLSWIRFGSVYFILLRIWLSRQYLTRFSHKWCVKSSRIIICRIWNLSTFLVLWYPELKTLK